MSEAPSVPTVERILSEEMIGTEQLCEILETVLFTGYLYRCIPISVIIIGPSGAGKSKLVMQYKDSIGCHVTTDVTSMGLQTLMADDKEQKIKFIVIPDFNIVLSHRTSTLQLTIGNLLSMTSEGVVRIDDGRAVKEVEHGPIGIISAMTRDMYASIGKKWVSLGFSRRFLPINYDYGLPTRMAIQHAIAKGAVTMLQLRERVFHRDNIGLIDVTISEEWSQRIMLFSDALATNIGYVPIRGKNGKPSAFNTGKQVEFSPHLVLRTLARAHALRGGRTEVDEDDIVFCMKAIEFTRFDRPVML